MINYKEFLEKTNVAMTDIKLIKQAFTHRSYINENREMNLEHNERLEFLGDAVLELVVTDFLYKEFPDKTEGDMTSLRSALVNAVTLADVAGELDVNDYLLLSKGESRDTGRARQYILANTMESIIGAIYMDAGYDEAKKFITKYVTPRVTGIIADGSWIDNKSKFQEKAQDEVSITPSYKTVKETGPDHDKRFEVGVYLGKDLVAKGEGKSKQDAEQDAAKKALESKGW